MKERFEGPNADNLTTALKRQEFTDASDKIVAALIEAGQLVEFVKGDLIVAQDSEDTDLYFLVAGSVAIVVNRNQIATRTHGKLIGEMTAVEPTLRRSADVRALETVVALKISSATFGEIGKSHPQIWQPVARELARRLNQRNSMIPSPNKKPKLFIISSAESLAIAREVQDALERDATPILWTDGVFFVSGYALKSLETTLDACDFAVAIAQADDMTNSRGEKSPTIRDNVVFELGLFMGRLSRYRTFLVCPRTPGLKLPSDLHGLNVAQYELGDDHLAARIAPACNKIRKVINDLGVRKLIDDPKA